MDLRRKTQGFWKKVNAKQEFYWLSLIDNQESLSYRVVVFIKCLPAGMGIGKKCFLIKMTPRFS